MNKGIVTLIFVLISTCIFAQTYLVNEGFESTSFPPTGWTNSASGCIRTTNNPRTGSACLGFNGVNDAIYTPVLANPNFLSFWYRRSSNTTAWTLKVQKSTNASTWTDLATISNVSGTYQEFTYDLSAESNIYIRLIDLRGTGTNERYVDDFTVTARESSGTPTITVVSSLTSFSSVKIGTNSSNQTYTVSGSNLTANISITAPTGFQISTSAGSGFGNSLTLNHSGGTVSNTTIYVRFSPNLVQEYSGNITHSSTGATTQNVAVSGTGIDNPVINLTPSQASITYNSAVLGGEVTNINLSNLTERGIYYSTTNGFADSAGTKVSSVGSFGIGVFTQNLSGLTSNTTYYFKSFATNAAGTSYSNQASFSTPLGPPEVPVATNATSITDSGFTANWNPETSAQSYRLDVMTSSGSGSATDLFFSEYIEGSSNNKAIEIFNGTGSTVDLSDYQVELYSNGSATVSNSVVLSGTLSNGSVYVIANSSANATILALANITNAVTSFNGNDALALKKISTGLFVDVFGRIGNDPGTAWTADGDYTTLDRTLVRKASISAGVTSSPTGTGPTAFLTLGTEWDVYAIDTISNLGSHTFSGGSSTYVSGYEDLTVNGTSQIVSGLNSGTQYSYRVRAYNTTATSANSNTIQVTTLQNLESPTIQASELLLYPASNAIVAEWTPGNGTKRLVKINTTNSFSNPLDGTDPVANPSYSGSGEQVVYNGTTEIIEGQSYNGVTIMGLAPETTYWIRIYELNGSGSETAYNTTTSTGNPTSTTTLVATNNSYYSGISGYGSTLKTNLHNLLRTTHATQYSYDALWTQLSYTDEDPDNSNNIIELYTGWSVPKSYHGAGTTQWNREHTWSKSHGDFGDTRPAGTDLHHMRPCDATVNSAKGNKDFDNGGSAYTDASPYTGYSGTTGCYTSTYTWEPRSEDKGDVARMLMYMAVRYEGTDTSYNLELVDYTNTAPNDQPHYGKLSTLLQWHVQDPPDARELQRNERIFSRQGNRNPFIDNPQYAQYIWAPIAGEATNVSETGFTINWTTPISATKYYLQVATDGGFQSFVSGYDNLDVGITTTRTFSNLSTNTTYYYRLRSYFTSGYSMYSPTGSILLQPILNPPDAPVASSATALTHNAFTARWQSVSGAQSYEVDLLSGTSANATDLIISEYVEGSSNRKAIELYNGTGTSISLTSYTLKKQTNGAGVFGDALNLTGTLDHGSAYVIVLSNASNSLKDEPYVDLATTSSCMQFNGNDCIALYKNDVMIDVVGVIDQVAVWGEDVTMSRNSDVLSPSVVFSMSDWTNHPMDTFGDLGSHQLSGGSISPVDGYEDMTPVGNHRFLRISGLDPETQYYYRVRAVNADGASPNSNLVAVQTPAFTPGMGANTAPAGESVFINLPPVSGNGAPAFGNTDIEIEHNAQSDADFTISMYWHPSGFESFSTIRLRYVISASETAALSGLYTFNHSGLGFLPRSIGYRYNGSWNTLSPEDYETSADMTILSIPSLAKQRADELEIVFGNQEGTLPVELSSFSATLNANNRIYLLWITESETNCLGFNVFRNDTEDLHTALRVSDLIPATNSSTQQSYFFVDRELSSDGTYYYWLENVDFDGIIHFYGPLSVIANFGTNHQTPNIPIISGIENLYPNPFNPMLYINYGVAREGHIKIDIYNPRGQKVRSLVDARKAPGYYRIQWQGIGDDGAKCTTGMYLVKFSIDGKTRIRKAMLVK